MKKENRLAEHEINYNVYNALNLYNEDLGEIYLTTKFNPFPNSFELTESFVVERFVNSSLKKETIEPPFLAQGNKVITQTLTNSAENCKLAILEIEKKLADPNIPDSLKEELKKLKIYLLCRIELLNNYTKQVKKSKNLLKFYTSIQSLDWKIGEIFDESYNEQFNIQVAINAYLEIAKLNSNMYKKELQNKALREQAQNIIKENQAKLEQANNKVQTPHIHKPSLKTSFASSQTKEPPSTKKTTNLER